MGTPWYHVIKILMMTKINPKLASSSATTVPFRTSDPIIYVSSLSKQTFFLSPSKQLPASSQMTFNSGREFVALTKYRREKQSEKVLKEKQNDNAQIPFFRQSIAQDFVAIQKRGNFAHWKLGKVSTQSKSLRHRRRCTWWHIVCTIPFHEEVSAQTLLTAEEQEK